MVDQRDGECVNHIKGYRFSDSPNKVRECQLSNAHGTTSVHVALPAMFGMNMCLYGRVESGVISQDSLDPNMFFKGMTDRGVLLDFDKNLFRWVVVL